MMNLECGGNKKMNIEELSVNISTNRVKTDWGMGVLKKTFSNVENLGARQAEMITKASVNGIGQNIDIMV